MLRIYFAPNLKLCPPTSHGSVNYPQMLKDALIQDHIFMVHRVSLSKWRGTFRLISSMRNTSMRETRAYLLVDKIPKQIQHGERREDMGHKEYKKRII